MIIFPSVINDSGTNYLAIRPFVNNTLELCSCLGREEVARWAAVLDKISPKRGFISAADITVYSKTQFTEVNHFKAMGWQDLYDRFPQTLTDRKDFVEHFSKRIQAKVCD